MQIEPVKSVVAAKVEHAVEYDVWDEVNFEIERDVWDEVMVEVWNGVGARVWAEVQDKIVTSLKRVCNAAGIR